jgi:hypothetical protein
LRFLVISQLILSHPRSTAHHVVQPWRQSRLNRGCAAAVVGIIVYVDDGRGRAMASGEFAERRRLFPDHLWLPASRRVRRRYPEALPVAPYVAAHLGRLRGWPARRRAGVRFVSKWPAYSWMEDASGTRTEGFWCRTIGTSVLKQPDVNYCTGGISFPRELEQHNIFLIYGGAATALGMVSHNAFCLIR